jgi:hypothetical protein
MRHVARPDIDPRQFRRARHAFPERLCGFAPGVIPGNPDVAQVEFGPEITGA